MILTSPKGLFELVHLISFTYFQRQKSFPENSA